MKHMRRIEAGLNLVELLVVIAVIALLLALLLPAITAAREKSRRTACLSQIRQMSLGMERYTSTFDGYFPSWTGWGGRSQLMYSDSYSWEPFEDGWYTDRSTGERVSMIGGGYWRWPPDPLHPN